VTEAVLKFGPALARDPQARPQYDVAAEAGPGARIPSPTAARSTVSQSRSFFIVGAIQRKWCGWIAQA
jgi:hypothetical protein